jgi:hypothetical protein
MHLYDSANSDLDSDTATWEVIDGHVFLTMPQLDGTVAAGDVRLTAASDAALPAEIQAAVTRFFPVVVIEGGTRQLTTGEFFHTDDKVHVNMTGGGAVRVDPQTIVYKL